MPIGLRSCALLVAGLLLCALPLALASGPPDAEKPRKSRRTERVEVLADAPDAEEVAAFATTLDVEEAASRGEDLGDLLRRVPGARVSSYAGLGRYATVSLRGSSAEQVTIIVDGVIQNRALGGAVDLSRIPLTQVDSITVYRGMPPASAGSGGMGGLVDIRTHRAGAEEDGRTDFLAGSYGTTRISGNTTINLGEERWLSVGAELIESEGAFAFLSNNGTLETTDDDEIVPRTNNDLVSRSLLVSSELGELLSGRVSARLRGLSREQGLPGTDALSSESASLEEEELGLSVVWARHEAGNVGAVEVMLDAFSHEVQLNDREGDLSLAKDQLTRIEGGALTLLARKSAGSHRLLARAEVRHERARVNDSLLSAPDRGGARRRSYVFTVEDRVSLGRLLLSPSLRGHWRKDDFLSGGTGVGGPPPPADDVSEAAFSGKISAACPLGQHWNFRGSVGHFLRVPNLLELFGDRGMVRGSPGLRPERGERVEAGVSWQGRWRGGPASGELVLHGTEARDLIVFVPNSLGTVIAQNVSAARVLGLEASTVVEPRRDLRVEASLSLMSSVDRSGAFADGQRLVGRPGIQGFLGVLWRPGSWRMNYELTYIGGNSTDVLDTPALRLPARVLHDLFLGLELRSGLEAGVEVRNVLDQKARDIARFPLPGRTIYAHLGWKWGGKP